MYTIMVYILAHVAVHQKNWRQLQQKQPQKDTEKLPF